MKNNLTKRLIEAKTTQSPISDKYSAAQLKNIEDIGIALVKASGSSDSNAGRLMFPIKNHNDQVVGFSARRRFCFVL